MCPCTIGGSSSRNRSPLTRTRTAHRSSRVSLSSSSSTSVRGLRRSRITCPPCLSADRPWQCVHAPSRAHVDSYPPYPRSLVPRAYARPDARAGHRRYPHDRACSDPRSLLDPSRSFLPCAAPVPAASSRPTISSATNSRALTPAARPTRSTQPTARRVARSCAELPRSSAPRAHQARPRLSSRPTRALP